MVRDVSKAWAEFEKYLVETRYAVRKPETGKPLEHSWKDVVERVGKYLLSVDVARGVKKFCVADCKREELLVGVVRAIKDRLIIPATPALMTFGNEYTRRKGYFSCYPLGCVPDTMDGIYDVCNKMREIYIRGGGCGIDVSKLRSRNSAVDNGQGIASGPVGFLPLFDAVTGTTNQGGRRRGALLVQMHWRHPDIRRFVRAKKAVPALSRVIWSLPEDERVDVPLSNMNISVVVDEEFFREGKELYDEIAESMWASGDPGLLFLHNMLKYSSFNWREDERDYPGFSNPCGEYLAPANTACNLVTVNVAKIAREAFDVDSGFDFERFYRKVFDVAYLACVFGTVMLFMDEGYPFEEIREATQRVRPVGVGMTGFHTALLLAYDGHVRYGYDEEALEFAENVQVALTLGTLKWSADLVGWIGKVYKWNRDYLEMHIDELREVVFGRDLPFEREMNYVTAIGRTYGGFFHAVTTSQPPTGSVSMFARVAGDTGIEPAFEVELVRRVRDFYTGEWKEVRLVTEYLADKLEDKEFRKRVERQLAHEVKPLQQLEMLARFQRFVHTGISKTINCPRETSVEEIKELIERSVQYRLKGFTVFRDGCREDTVYVKERKVEEAKREEVDLGNVREGYVYEVDGTVKAYITTSFDREGNLREVFVNVGKAGTTLNSMFQAVGRIISVGLRHDARLAEKFIKTLKGIEMGEFYKCGEIRAKGLPDMIAKVMEDAIRRKRGEDCVVGSNESERKVGDLCPQCGELAVVREGNCAVCERCGFTIC
jgi:ribonucleoside-diphosphate reductase alpha chain